jgi:hypothetical protein
VFDNINFSYKPDCPLVLQQTSPQQVRHNEEEFANAGSARVLWEGKRGPDRHEMFRLLRVN